MNPRSYLFIGFLIMLSSFLCGVKYASSLNSSQTTRSAARVNRREITPPVASPSPIQFGEFIHTGCKFTMLLPKPFEEESISTQGGTIQVGNQRIVWNCGQKKQSDPTGKPLSVTLQNKKIIATESETEVIFSIKHPFSNFPFTMHADKNLFPLIINTLEFRN